MTCSGARMGRLEHGQGGGGRRPPLVILDTGGGVQKGAGANEDDPRGEVVVESGRIDEVVDAAESNMIRSRVPFYVRGDMLTILADSESRRRNRLGDTLPSLVQATPPMILEAMESSSRFVSRTRDGHWRVQSCPRNAPSVYLGRVGRYRFPEARGVSLVPILRDDGNILTEGHDPDSGMVVCAAGKWPSYIGQPSEADARAALLRVSEIIGGFPFVSESDRAVTVAAFMTAVLRPSLPTAPGFAWSASVRGSGKSKLADVCAALATGAPAAPLSWPAQSDEQEKRLGAALLAGDPVIAIDNVESGLRGDCLNILLTQQTMAIRVLGRSVQPRVAVCALLTMTGNNLLISGDLTRRVLVSHLDPACERPELRRFDFDPVARAIAERRELVAALLQLARWGQTVRGTLPPLGSFEVWSRRVRDPLVALGMSDPCACLDLLHKEDPERETAFELMSEWQRAFGVEAVTVAAAIRKATDTAGTSRLRDALDAVAGGPGGLNGKRLGRYMLKLRDRHVGGMAVRREEDPASNAAAWRIELFQHSTGPWLDGEGDARAADDYRAARDGDL